MKAYDYKVYCKINNDDKFRYVMPFRVQANSNNEAKIIGEKMWKEQVEKSDRLKKANIVKICCRACETKQRQRKTKMTSLEKAISQMNTFINCELSK